MTQPATEKSVEEDGPWFGQAREIDSDWIELAVSTPDGQVHYRVPRRTHFDAVDAVVDLIVA